METRLLFVKPAPGVSEKGAKTLVAVLSLSPHLIN